MVPNNYSQLMIPVLELSKALTPENVQLRAKVLIVIVHCFIIVLIGLSFLLRSSIKAGAAHVSPARRAVSLVKLVKINSVVLAQLDFEAVPAVSERARRDDAKHCGVRKLFQLVVMANQISVPLFEQKLATRFGHLGQLNEKSVTADFLVRARLLWFKSHGDDFVRAIICQEPVKFLASAEHRKAVFVKIRRLQFRVSRLLDQSDGRRQREARVVATIIIAHCECPFYLSLSLTQFYQIVSIYDLSGEHQAAVTDWQFRTVLWTAEAFRELLICYHCRSGSSKRSVLFVTRIRLGRILGCQLRFVI